MEKRFDPNVPDTSNGDFFCRLCCATANSEYMWESHIAGKRHIKNMMKFPDGIPPRQYDEDHEDSVEKPAKYRRYEKDEEWDDYCPKEQDVGYYRRKDYIPEIKPQVIDYGHKKSLPEEILPSSSKIIDDVSLKKEHEDLIEKIFRDERFYRLKKPFEEEYFKRQADGTLQNKWCSNNLKESREDVGLLFDRLKKPFEEESSKRQADGTLQNKWNDSSLNESRKDLGLLFDILKKPFEKESSKRQADGTLQNKWDSRSLKESRKKTVDHDDFEKELDELLYNSSNNSDLKNKDVFCNFKKKIDDILHSKSTNRESKDRDVKIIDDDCSESVSNDILYSKSTNRESKDRDPEIIDIVDFRKDVSHKRSNKTKILNHSITMKKINDKDKPKLHKDLEKKKRRKEDDEDFVDIFHKMNDQTLFQMSAADEAEDNSTQKSSKTENSKLEDIDPDKLTPDLIDNLLSSFLKPKASSSKGKDSSESCKKCSAVKNVKEDDLDIIAEKIESLPPKTFFQIIITRLKKLDLKDSDELSMLLDVISEAQAVVCKKLPPHLQAVIKSKMSQNHSKAVPVPVQYPQLPQSNSFPTALPLVSHPVSQPVQTVPQPFLKRGSQSLSQGEINSAVSQSDSQVVPQPVQAPVTCVQPQTKPSLLNTSDSLQSMIAWQNYLASKETASTKPTVNASNSVLATIAYQNYLSSLQAKAAAAASSKTTSENLTSVFTPSNSKTTISMRPYCTSVTPTVSRTVPSSAPGKSTLNTSDSVHTKRTAQNFRFSEQIAASKTLSQTSSSSSAKFALPRALRSSQIQTSVQNDKYVPQVNVQTTSSRPELPSNPAPVPNQTALQNYQAYYQQMYGMYSNRMPSNVDSRTSASTSPSWQNPTVSKPSITFSHNSQFGGSK